MKKGVVMFVYRDEVIESKAYQSVWERKDIVKKWEVKYKRQWGEKCAIQILPKSNIKAINLDGTNKRGVNGATFRFRESYERA